MVGSRTREATSAVLRGLRALALATVAIIVCAGVPSRGREISLAIEGVARARSASAQGQDAAFGPFRDAQERDSGALKAVESEDDDDDTRFDDDVAFEDAPDFSVIALRATPERDARCEAHVDTSRFAIGAAQARAPPV
jgi:hypothetical protein